MNTVFMVMAVVACPLGMGAMMWMMMRGHGDANTVQSQEQLLALRAEIDQLKSQRQHTL